MPRSCSCPQPCKSSPQPRNKSCPQPWKSSYRPPSRGMGPFDIHEHSPARNRLLFASSVGLPQDSIYGAHSYCPISPNFLNCSTVMAMKDLKWHFRSLLAYIYIVYAHRLSKRTWLHPVVSVCIGKDEKLYPSQIYNFEVLVPAYFVL